VDPPDARTGIPAFPFCHLRLLAPKPAGNSYPTELRTVGDHVRKRRLDLGLNQGQVAEQFNATVQTVCNWEKGRSQPEPRHYPAVIRFLGYDPSPEPASLGERIQAARRREGLSQKELARKLRLDPATIWRWETGDVRKPHQRLTRLFEEYVQEV
jgi:transcriptional regulator with XRE-family HTH domain